MLPTGSRILFLFQAQSPLVSSNYPGLPNASEIPNLRSQERRVRHPVTPKDAQRKGSLGPPRAARTGNAQEPSLNRKRRLPAPPPGSGRELSAPQKTRRGFGPLHSLVGAGSVTSRGGVTGFFPAGVLALFLLVKGMSNSASALPRRLDTRIFIPIQCGATWAPESWRGGAGDSGGGDPSPCVSAPGRTTFP